MKEKLKLLIVLSLLTACTDPKVYAEVFDKCMAHLADARKGTSYTTNDDEDLDEAIYACSSAASAIAQSAYKKEAK